MRTEGPWGRWEPTDPPEVTVLFAVLAEPWWIAGGYAIQSAVGRGLREHGDIDVAVLRRGTVTGKAGVTGGSAVRSQR
ncbi:Aminoglycoside-2''-adenylyltransferase [Frankia torreyi]|uniref:Aminoglycoside-2''-adenylyltransferase n=1 Tax=Frankia torreyi TaxID=1856 RepID=A0A0D8BGW8_9ACTN|nr:MULTISPECIES: hypothetical protein [Frankia]KJE23523.1 Aminoglycoside-2''-adenylyltransferase [Frankia torreyi]KQC34966.1 hypothetical protein UK82_28995 [Frankia sp. ACN1ag]KQM05475.1 Aminoglycoside-2''-adenylyltransferase [Frankia sp. CpI1-P]